MINTVVVLIVIAILVGIVGYCFYFISSQDLTAREGSLISVILTIFSALATWIVTHLYSQYQHKKAIQDVQEFHRNNLRTYARKAAEKVNNLSNELGRLSVYLADELERSDVDDPNNALLSREERMTSAIHIVDTLKSVNDTSLSDWEGVIDDLLDQQREEKEEKEEELRDIVGRLETLWDAQVDSVHDGHYESDNLKVELDEIRKDLRSVVSAQGLTQVKIRRKIRTSKQDVQGKCPQCGIDVSYRQRPIARSWKALECQSCGTKFLSRYREEQGFVLERRMFAHEKTQCLSCSSILNVELDTCPGSSAIASCEGCKEVMRVSRNADGTINVKLSGHSQRVLSKQQKVQFTDDVIQKVKEKLPQQPWPKGIHKSIAEDLNLHPTLVNRAINELIRRGIFKPQIDGRLFIPEPPSTTKD
jgi:predicted RNA-binding Zn-ribbon protein involved in translation (DUF1610 family)